MTQKKLTIKDFEKASITQYMLAESETEKYICILKPKKDKFLKSTSNEEIQPLPVTDKLYTYLELKLNLIK